MEETLALGMKGVTKSYGRFELGPIDLQIEPGYRVAVVGPNGSGKSTLFRLILNLCRPTSGELEVLGVRYPEGEIDVKRRIGYMPDAAIGLEEMTSGEAANFLANWYPNWNNQEFKRLVREFEIDPDEKFRKLSKGTQQRLLFALTMAHDSDLLLLDEPTANLDPFASRLMMEEVSAYMETGERTVIFATHAMDEVRKYADYVTFLYKGNLLGFFEKDEVLDSWKEIWVEELPGTASDVPGVVAIEAGHPVRLISSRRDETERALKRLEIPVLKVQNLELDEIFAQLMREFDQGRVMR